MREDGRGWERMGEDGRNLAENRGAQWQCGRRRAGTGEDERGWDGSELAEVEGVGGGGEDESGGGELDDVEGLCEAFGM